MRSRRNTVILAALITVLLVFGAFRSCAPSGGARSPVDISNKNRAGPVNVLAMVPGPSELFGCVRLCTPYGLFESDGGSAVVLYDEPNQGSQNTSSFAWDLVGDYDGRWYSVSGGSGSGSGMLQDAPQLISLVSIPVPQSTITYRYGTRPGYVMTMGKLLSPEVARFDVRYDTGQVVQQRTIVSKDGKTSAFALFAQAKAVCEVRLIDSNGAVLQQIDQRNDPMLAMEVRQNAPGACQ